MNAVPSGSMIDVVLAKSCLLEALPLPSPDQDHDLLNRVVSSLMTKSESIHCNFPRTAETLMTKSSVTRSERVAKP
jgi:hypothetical protein